MLKQQHDCSNEQEMRATKLFFVNCCVFEQICCTIDKIIGVTIFLGSGYFFFFFFFLKGVGFGNFGVVGLEVSGGVW